MKFCFGLCLCAIVLSGCNVFSGIDKPTTDAQKLSAADFCFNHGDFPCAAKYYGELSKSSNDEAIADSVFLTFAESGITASSFIDSVTGDSGAGIFITKLANTFGSKANEATRLSLFHAYQDHKVIQDKKLQGMIRFITSLTLFAEILGEAAATPGSLSTSDLVSSPKACKDAMQSCTPASPSTCTNTLLYCTPPSSSQSLAGSQLLAGTPIASMSDATDSMMNGSAPTLHMTLALVQEMSAGISELSSSSNIIVNTDTFVNELNTGGETAISYDSSQVYRGLLIRNGIGN